MQMETRKCHTKKIQKCFSPFVIQNQERDRYYCFGETCTETIKFSSNLVIAFAFGSTNRTTFVDFYFFFFYETFTMACVSWTDIDLTLFLDPHKSTEFEMTSKKRALNEPNNT